MTCLIICGHLCGLKWLDIRSRCLDRFQSSKKISLQQADVLISLVMVNLYWWVDQSSAIIISKIQPGVSTMDDANIFGTKIQPKVSSPTFMFITRFQWWIKPLEHANIHWMFLGVWHDQHSKGRDGPRQSEPVVIQAAPTASSFSFATSADHC